jgi:cytosine/uracil/thiamine/allantoin permease
VFNQRARGGVYWYSGGWNPRATVSWALGAVTGLAAVTTPFYEGPLLALTGGVDCSFVLSGLVGGLVYAALTFRSSAAPAAAAQVQGENTEQIWTTSQAL